MSGKDLFQALGNVRDEYITEAEEYTGRRVISMHTVQWIGALAACLCVLVGWAFAANWFSNPIKEGASGEAGAGVMVEENTEAAQDHETANDIHNEKKDESNAAVYAESECEIINRYTGEDEVSCELKSVENGSVEIDGCLQEMMETYAEEDVRFLVTVVLSQDQKQIPEHDAQYTAEIERLTDLGYAFRMLPAKLPETTDGSKTHICALVSADQLYDFDALEKYGYFITFAENYDHTPLDWNDPAGCDFP